MSMSVRLDSGWKGLMLMMGSRVNGVTYYGVDDCDDDDEYILKLSIGFFLGIR